LKLQQSLPSGALDRETNMVEVSRKVRQLFELAKEDIELPFFSTFPKNSCEGASIFLGMILKEKYPTARIDYVKGYSKNRGMHFWLEVDGKVFDVTADQFPQIESPIWAAEYHPLSEMYPNVERVEINKAFELSDLTNETYKLSLMIEIRHYLALSV
jgi:hypothetical protein